YQLAEALGIATPATRLARIHYINKGTNTNFTRNALLIETDKKIGERLGAAQVSEPELADADSTGIDPVDGAIYHLFHKMIGNDDVQLRTTEKPFMTTPTKRALFNAILFELPNKKRIPVVYDLDMSSIVADFGKMKHIPEFNLVSSGTTRFMIRSLSLRQKFTDQQLTKAITLFKSRKDLLYQTVQGAQVDEEGRAIARKHLDVFFASADLMTTYSMITQEG